MELKILFGQYKGKKITYPKDFHARPTLARSRDVLFNWQQSFKGLRCLDLFAGTGIIGLEALSLGAEFVDFIDLNRTNAHLLKQTLKKMSLSQRCRVTCTDAFNWLNKNRDVYDFIFIDPPFDKDLHFKILAKLATSSSISSKTIVFVESPNDIEFPCEWEQLKEKKIGKVKIYLIKKAEVESE